MKKKLLLVSILACSSLYGEDIGNVNLEESNIVSRRDIESSTTITQNKNTFIITEEQIQEKKYQNVEEVLQDAPGIIIQNTPFGPRIDMRGSGEKSLSRVKVLIDGVSINPTESAMASLPINSIPVESIRKIEIIPGGGATLYGSGTVGGVVNISTNSSATKNNFLMDLSAGSFDNKSLGLAGGYNLNKNLYVSYGFKYLNSEGYRELEQKDNKIFQGGFDYKINEKNRIRLQGRTGNETNDGTTEVTKKILSSNRKESGKDLDVKTKSDNYTFDYQFKPTDKLTLTSTLFRQKQNRDLNTESLDDVTIELTNALKKEEATSSQKTYFYDVKSKMKAKFKEQKDGIKLRGKYEYDNGEALIGYDYTEAKINRNSKVSSHTIKSYYDGNTHMTLRQDEIRGITNQVKINLSKKSHGVYIFNKYELNDKWNITTGIRGEFTEYEGSRKNGPNTMPMVKPKDQSIETNRSMENYAGEIGTMYKYSDLGNVYARYERGFVTPFPSQLTDKIQDPQLETTKNNKDPNAFMSAPYVNVASIYVDNNLKAETTDTIELGIRDYINNSYVSLAFFVTDTTDEIVLLQSGVTNPAIKRWQYKNIGKTRRMGIEAEADQVFEKFEFNQSVTLIDAKTLKGNESAQIKKGDKIPLVPKAKITLGAKYKFTEKLAISGSYIYITSKEAREMTDTDKTMKFKINGYGVTDVAVTYKLDEYSSVKAGIKNLTSTEYNLRETSIEAVPAPERNYYLSLNVKF
ncbi:TonB-dependent receptor [uncultured Cetobacterium sp.]|uniref:TonB-dependent receptor n=1 Tax=uncultured Cetobacterium sp. TaxID=527638 RepID=UPI002630AE8F|nr:TonB-dependent receptor [uncultured Cetobacterium sp.]